MRYAIGVLMICLFAGCAGTPPKAPTVKGEYRPINKVDIAESLSIPTSDRRSPRALIEDSHE